MKAKSLDESFKIISIIANKISSSMSSEQLATNVQYFLETFMRIEYSGLYFYDEKSKRLKLIYAKNFSKKEKNEAEKTAMDRHPGLVFRTRKHLLIKDTTKSKDSSSSKRSFKILSRLYIPLVIEDKCVGTFGLGSSIKNNFSEYDIKILSVVGAMTAMRVITINKEEENQEHLKKNLKLTRSLNIVNTFADVIHESNTIDDVVWSITQNAISELGYIDCVVYLIDEAGEYLIQRAAYGNKNPASRDILKPIKVKIGDGVVGCVAAKRKGEIIPDTSKDKRYITDDISRLSEITVPIVHGNNIIGVIDSEHSEKNFFPEEHLELLTTIALMTATKLIQIKYNEEIIAHQNHLEETVEKRTNDLIEVEKLAVLGRLSAGVAHEMNTPLGAIASSSDNLTGILRELFADGMENTNHTTVIEACKLADDLMVSDAPTSREERKERKVLAEHLKYKYKVGPAASNHATSLVECGVLTKHKDILDHIYQSEDIEEALELTLILLRIRKSIDIIGLASQKAAKVVRALKSYVHNDNTSSVEVFDVRRSVHDVLLLFTNKLKQNVELHVDMESELLLQGNESELSKVWSNLIANALYAMQNSGNLWVQGESNKQNIILTFRNDGPAILNEVQERLFEPFYTTKPVGKGSGMGLSIAFNVIASMNGSIEVETGETTTFTVTIPKIKG